MAIKTESSCVELKQARGGSEREASSLFFKPHKTDDQEPSLGSQYFAAIMGSGLAEKSFQVKVEREETVEDMMTLKEEDTEKPVTHIVYSEPDGNNRSEGFLPFKQIKVEPCSFPTEVTVKQEVTAPELTFDCKPLKSECIDIAASVTPEFPVNEKELSEDHIKPHAETQLGRQGELVPECSNPAHTFPLLQTHKGRQLRGNCTHTKKRSCSVSQRTLGAYVRRRREKQRIMSPSCKVVSDSHSLNERDETGLSSDGDSPPRHLRCHRRSQPAISLPSPQPDTDSGPDEEEQDPTWGPSAIPHPNSRTHSRADTKEIRNMGRVGRNQEEVPPKGGGKKSGGARRYQCPLCCKAFLTKRDLERHRRVHSGEKPFACGLCGRCFNDIGNMRKHMLVHSGKKPHVCTYCQKGFADRGNLRRHLKTHEPVEKTPQPKFVCEACGKSYKEKGGLVRHVKAEIWEGKGGCLMKD